MLSDCLDLFGEHCKKNIEHVVVLTGLMKRLRLARPYSCAKIHTTDYRLGAGRVLCRLCMQCSTIRSFSPCC